MKCAFQREHWWNKPALTHRGIRFMEGNNFTLKYNEVGDMKQDYRRYWDL